MYIPSNYQEDIFNQVLFSSRNILIEARPGSGKTSTLIEISNKLRGSHSLIFLAFSVQVTKYIKEKVKGIECRTINGLGALTIQSKRTGVLDINKYDRLIKDLIKNGKSIPFYAIPSIIKLVSLCQCNLANSKEEIISTIDHFSADIRKHFSDEEAAEIILSLFNLSVKDFYKTGSHNFTDQIWLPNVLKLSPPKYEVVLGDEAQDFNRAQLDLILKAGDRHIFVGDTYQCQPRHTQVYLSEGIQKPIQFIKPGDTVLSFGLRKSGNSYQYTTTKNNRVLAVNNHKYSEEYLYTVQAFTSKNESRCTYNHKWIVKLNRVAGYIVYLMASEDNKFRVGTTKVGRGYNSSKTSKTLCFLGKPEGLVSRLKANNGSKAWILSYHKTKEEALAQETIVSCRYGLPQTIFVDRDVNRQVYIDLIFNNLRTEKDYYIKAAMKCLKDHGRAYEYPLLEYKKLKISDIYTPSVFQVEACNLIPEIMLLPIPSKTLKSITWDSFKVEKKWVGASNSIDVFSIEVEGYHSYISDGIFTHNSIMGYSGADCESIARLKAKTNAIELPLPICYRCPTSHLDLARKLVPDIENGRKDKGVVRNIKLEEMLSQIKEGEVVICRNNAPLIRAAIKLTTKEKKCRVLGQDITESLIPVIEKLDFSNFLTSLLGWKHKQKRSNSKLSELIQIEVEDRFEAIKYCWEGANKTKDKEHLISYVKALFSRKGDCIFMSSIHRIKGMEYETVYILNASGMPLKWRGQKDWELQQELNLKHVALTRSTQNLYLVD